MSAKPPIYFRARTLYDEHGNPVLALVPASYTDSHQPAWASLRPGDRRRGQLTAPRNPRFHRYVFALARLAGENIDEFAGMSAHEVLKRCQAEAGVECDTIMLDAETLWPRITDEVVALIPDQDGIRTVMNLLGDMMRGKRLAVHWPRSLAFDSMDQDRFKELTRAICSHLSRRYWPACTPEQIAQMAEMQIDGAA